MRQERYEISLSHYFTENPLNKRKIEMQFSIVTNKRIIGGIVFLVVLVVIGIQVYRSNKDSKVQRSDDVSMERYEY